MPMKLCINVGLPESHPIFVIINIIPILLTFSIVELYNTFVHIWGWGFKIKWWQWHPTNLAIICEGQLSQICPVITVLSLSFVCSLAPAIQIFVEICKHACLSISVIQASHKLWCQVILDYRALMWLNVWVCYFSTRWATWQVNSRTLGSRLLPI